MMRLVSGLCVALVVIGCRSKKPDSDSAQAKPSASAARAVVSAAESTPEPEPPELPTESDFEAEAAEQINGSNLEKELDRLEQELLGR